MKNLKVLFGVLMLALFLMPQLTNAQAVSTKNVDMPFGVWIPCVPEVASGTLTLHVVMVADKDGNVFKTHYQPAGGELIGEVTGTVYHPVGVTQNIWKASIDNNGAMNKTYINNFIMVGTGKDGVTYRVQVVYHVTVNADGELSVIVDNSRNTCE
jgi:hypothetical protein